MSKRKGKWTPKGKQLGKPFESKHKGPNHKKWSDELDKIRKEMKDL